MTGSDISVKCMYCGRLVTPRDPTAKGHLYRRCLHDIQVSDRL